MSEPDGQLLPCEEFLSTGVKPVDCSICKEPFSSPDHMPVVVPHCEHQFGRSCLEAWAKSDAPATNTCPLCRQILFRPVPPGAATPDLQVVADWIQFILVAALCSSKQLKRYDDRETFLSRLWRRIWTSFKDSYEADPSSVSDVDLKETALFVISELQPGHPDITVLRPFELLLRTYPHESAALSPCITRLARIVLYATTSYRKVTSPRGLLGHILHLHTNLPVTESFSLTQVEAAAGQVRADDAPCLRLIMGIMTVNRETMANFSSCSLHSAKTELKSMLQHWPGELPRVSLQKAVFVGSNLIQIAGTFEAQNRCLRWMNSEFSSDDDLNRDTQTMWQEAMTFVDANPHRLIDSLMDVLPWWTPRLW